MQSASHSLASRVLTFPTEPAHNQRRSIMEIRAHALARAELGWTRSEATHRTLELLESSGLVSLELSELRLASLPGAERLRMVWAGSRWTLTPAGRSELDRLRRVLPDVPSDELASWGPASVVKSERVSRGIYSVQLANKARATVADASQVPSGVASRGWYWIDRRGGCQGFKTKADAIESFRRYRG